MPFLRTSEGARLTAVMTENACFLVSRKTLRRVFTSVPWEQVRFTVSVMPGEDIVFYTNGKKLGTLFPDWDVVGGGQPRPAVAPGGFHEWSGTARACLQRRLPAMSKVGVPSRSTDQPGSPRLQAPRATCLRRNQLGKELRDASTSQ